MIAALLLVGGCDCRGCIAPEEIPYEMPEAMTDDGEDEVEVDVERPDEARVLGPTDAAPPGLQAAPPQSPVVVAQRFLVSWATGRLSDAVTSSDEAALELVQRAQAGETVETPLGEIDPVAPRAGHRFAFSEITISQLAPDLDRVELSLTLTPPGSRPVTTRHVLAVRRTDGKVIRWRASGQAGPDGGR
jgi:hypothetical protein